MIEEDGIQTATDNMNVAGTTQLAGIELRYLLTILPRQENPQKQIKLTIRLQNNNQQNVSFYKEKNLIAAVQSNQLLKLIQ